MNDFIPKIEGIKREHLFKYQDELGDVCLGGAGSMPEFGFCFYYRDARYEFCFYADCVYDGSKSGVEIFDVEVKNATLFRFRGSPPKIDHTDVERIARNMAKFFFGAIFSRYPQADSFH